MDLVHQAFLDWLHKQRNEVRLSNYHTYGSYYDGDHEVAIPPKVRAALKSELGTVTNYCRLVVDSPVDYIMGGGVSVECVDNPAAERALYEVYESNGLLTEEMMKALTVMGKKGDVFLKLYISESAAVKVRVLRPDICFPRYMTDDYTELYYCAIQYWEDSDDFTAGSGGKYKAQVFRPDVVDYYESTGSRESQQQQWEHVDQQPNILGFIPIIHMKNTIDDLEFGVSDLQVMTDLQDALNKTVTDMLLTMDNQAFQRMFIFGAQSPDEIVMEPGMITEYSNPDGSVEVVEAASIEAFLEAMREIVDQICTVSQISKVAIMKSDVSRPESGLALRIHYMPLEMKADKKRAIIQRRFQQLNQMIFAALSLTGQGDFRGVPTKLHFKSGLPTDEQLQSTIHEMELRNKVKSRRTVMEERGIDDPDAELAEIDIDDYETEAGE